MQVFDSALTSKQIQDLYSPVGIGAFLIDDQGNIIGIEDVDGYKNSSLWVKFRCWISNEYKREKFPLSPIPLKND